MAGSRMLVRLTRPRATHRANSSTTASAPSSPSRAAAWTCSPRTRAGSPPATSTTRRSRPPTAASRASCARPEPDANRSQQPRRPQTQGGPFGSTTMWPNSPVNPWAPTRRRPPATTPPPIPVPSVTITMSSQPRPAPTVHSDSAAQVASLPTTSGTLSRAPSRPATSTSATSGMLGDARRTPSSVTRPGTPTPSVGSGPASASSAPATSASASMRASPPRGVGRRVSATTSPSASITTPRHFVPPTSMPAAATLTSLGLGAGLQLAHRVEDAHLGPTLDEAG